MDQLRIVRWTSTLCVLLSWMRVDQVVAEPQYVVAIPAVIEAGAETRFCATLRQPSETLVMTVTLRSREKNTTLLTHTSNEAFQTCTQFKAPLVQNREVQDFQVEVRGDTFYSKEVRKVMIKAYDPLTFIQTDKPIYLPGQKVNFRVVTMDNKMRPVNQLYSVIELEDPNDNRVGQWLNETSSGKILQLSYSLDTEAREGPYQIIVSVGANKVYHSFKVEKYVLPKFDVTLNVHEEVNIEQEEIEAEVCAKYTYGQPVPGLVIVNVCRPVRWYVMHSFDLLTLEDNQHDSLQLMIAGPCRTERKQADKTGCTTFSFKMSFFNKIDQMVLQDVLDIKTKVKEDGTSISRPQEKRIQISYVLGKVSFIDMPKFWERGSNVEGKVKAVYHNNTPIYDTPVYLFVGSSWEAHSLQNLTTDSNGVASFSFNTDGLPGYIQLHASLTSTLDTQEDRTVYYETGEHTVPMFQPSSPDGKTISSLEVKKKDKPLPCDTEEDIYIQYTIVGEAQGSVDVMYLVLSRGAVTTQGLKQFKVPDRSVTEGQVSFKLRVSHEVAPEFEVVAYAILPSETIIAHSTEFSTDKCFSNKVSLEFSPSSAVPGEETNMQVKALPHSLCGVSAVDKSVLIKEPGITLDADKIFDLLPIKKSSHVPYEVRDATECLNVRPKRYILPYPGQKTPNIADEVFQKVGLKMATNLFFRLPSCLNLQGKLYHAGPDLAYDHNTISAIYSVHMVPVPVNFYGHLRPEAPPVETIRSFFPETWIWDLVEVGDNGKKDVSLTVPDTITTWETEAFCLSSQGFGLAPRKEMKVFQPFFLELTMPYSVIRGEHFKLKATVFNYLTSCIMVTVTPRLSSDYTLKPLSGDQYTFCLCTNDRKTLRWNMIPTALGVVNVTVSAEAVASHVSCDNEVVSVPDRGRIDIVTKPLIVKAEGTEVTKTYNWLLCPKGNTQTEETEIQLPENVIEGSARTSVSVLGDILGRALKNLDGLLQMPYGCGEQNMALLAPNIYILQYLKGTQQLTSAIMEKAANFLTSGYQRQLNYKSYDGAYTTFGTGPGNTWLTAFVVRSFSKAQSFIYIDPRKIKESKTWLEQKQQENGCFETSGKLFNNRMKGGVSDEVTLSAYITAAFLEMKISPKDPVVNNSLVCLKESISDLSNTYTTALLAYIFTLAGDMETRAHLMRHLDTVAVKEGSFLYWSQTVTETSASLSVEISSYVLLAKLSASPTVEDLGYASGIIRWLTGQQNYYGGFSSTQDTVVALQALALYSTLVFSPEGSSTVTVQTPSSQLTFDVNQDNKLLYQEKTMQDVSGKYSLEVKGTACASVQISVHYNIPTPTDVTTLSVKVKPEVDTMSESTKLTLKIKSLYSGKESTTNMVILDIKMLSGFVPDPESLTILKGALMVDRVEQKEDQVLVYLQELPKDTPISHSLAIIQELPVDNLKPAVVKIYDYYQPSDQAETEYIFIPQV
ncbi:alpha-2-macroglobulin-like isoform X2 [Archocentrus centrarchus]|uniref:alpha-2-macroglobulin-like isoform X2 n=1 Tax=Archocentrus centrarchus TaxID=63155 RepID=UPI0011E9D51F|nr:alpha-2-macroglobulin-like isoform X2 [Archocentrus centrarchus]